MKIANLHDDIGTDIYAYRDQEPNRLDTYHYPKLKKGNIALSAIVCFFDGKQSWKEMQETILYSEKAILESTYFSFQQDKQIQVFLAVEGMCGIQEEVEEKIAWMYTHHVRVASLVWNEDNALACGAKAGNKHLTPLGIKAIQTMNKLNMLIDVSHLCERGFYDVIALSTKPIIATHSNAFSLCAHARNLKDKQLEVLANHQGFLGCVPVRYFTTTQKENQNLTSFINMVTYCQDKMGPTQIGFGFDFMDYASEENESEMIMELPTIEHLHRLVDCLRNHFPTNLVQAMLYDNVYRFLQPIL